MKKLSGCNNTESFVKPDLSRGLKIMLAEIILSEGFLNICLCKYCGDYLHLFC